MPEERYKLTIKGTSAGKVALSDPISGQDIPVKILRREPGMLELEVSVVDTPRMLTIKP